MFKVIKLNIDLTRLKSGIVDYIEVDVEHSFSKEELENTSILEFNNCKITGTISNTYEDLEINLSVEGAISLPCAVSLKPVNYPINIKIEGNFKDLFAEIDTNVENSIDIFPIIWENILMEIPLRVVSDDLSDVKTSGEGWRLITEKEEEINPELAKLKDLL